MSEQSAAGRELAPIVKAEITPQEEGRGVPALIMQMGAAAQFAWDEFFKASIRNTHTRTAYGRAVRRFLAWCEERGLELPRVTPGHLGDYFGQHTGTIPTKSSNSRLHSTSRSHEASARGERSERVRERGPRF